MINVGLRPPSRAGRLFPRYDDVADILEVSSAVQRDWPLGIDVDGRLIFDMDGDGLVVNIDLLIPRRRWKIGGWPGHSNAQKADVLLAPETIAVKSHSMPISILTDEDRSYAVIRLGRCAGSPRSIELSERCYAVLEGNRLCGLDVILAPLATERTKRRTSAALPRL